ncbi:2-dehydropantoate 2-reductase [Pseudonocardia sp. Ae168_Ps1]|uniref:M20/M25/M40 family metallo-hydrolase n=1 Tax=unclassified Pseudonocardia TaxID=2619320 RepID=UPI000968E2BE|nr:MULTISPECIES: M20/M25/M40 family metallo-hydrolase [unclassified Pseudonocardia]OLL72201.1 2-dehydropantoate 2-reductase [Pseudonocardia sp. Ae150A_Ps1]OLL78170.1 2-dehydropantoate 2-reductase [Pseudonocardia sp. Ae168_Ps1]OLL87708.1 2-dehydropantoate 2-reductase [Pseudonocardia sp. Ae263_Ps1]OLL92265.1 2-dehydropantoate 2-reductase [Pseudonocardia sp. Ae356_Ps1]
MTHALLDAAEAALPSMLDDLRGYVETETPSDDRPSLEKGLAWLDGLVAERCGPASSSESVDGGPYGDVRVLDLAGSSAAPVLLLAHYDTVWPVGTLAGMPFAVDGDRITGPGVFDMKAGLVQALWAIRIAHSAGLALPPLRLLLTGDEEIGSPASRPVIERAADGVRAALVFEAAGPGGEVKTARKGVGMFRVDVDGVEAHAGLDPTAGTSAVDELARVVLALHGARDLDAGTSVNVGVVGGGSRSNVTAGRAWGEIDVRVSSAEEITRIERVLAELRPADPAAALRISGEWNRPVMERTPRTAELYGIARSAASGIGVDLPEIAVGGASDANFLSVRDVGVLDGLGALGAGAHARHEHALVSGMVRQTALTAALLHALA